MNKSLFTKQELQDLRREFVKFKLADMDSEDLFAYIRDMMMNDLIDLDEEELRDEIDAVSYTHLTLPTKRIV